MLILQHTLILVDHSFTIDSFMCNVCLLYLCISNFCRPIHSNLNLKKENTLYKNKMFSLNHINIVRILSFNYFCFIYIFCFMSNIFILTFLMLCARRINRWSGEITNLAGFSRFWNTANWFWDSKLPVRLIWRLLVSGIWSTYLESYLRSGRSIIFLGNFAPHYEVSHPH
jgi:hypothetical protein